MLKTIGGRGEAMREAGLSLSLSLSVITIYFQISGITGTPCMLWSFFMYLKMTNQFHYQPR